MHLRRAFFSQILEKNARLYPPSGTMLCTIRRPSQLRPAKLRRPSGRSRAPMCFFLPVHYRSIQTLHAVFVEKIASRLFYQPNPSTYVVSKSIINGKRRSRGGAVTAKEKFKTRSEALLVRRNEILRMCSRLPAQ